MADIAQRKEDVYVAPAQPFRLQRGRIGAESGIGAWWPRARVRVRSALSPLRAPMARHDSREKSRGRSARDTSRSRYSPPARSSGRDRSRRDRSRESRRRSRSSRGGRSRSRGRSRRDRSRSRGRRDRSRSRRRSRSRSRRMTGPGGRASGNWGGDWACDKCNTNNFARRGECFKCGASKP